MTNFQGLSRQPGKLITPETAVIFLPIAGGLLLSTLGIFGAMLPLIATYQQRSASVSQLEQKKANLSLAKRQLANAVNNYNLRVSQQQRLLALVSGTSTLRTWLTAVNRLADSNQVSILEVDKEYRETFTPTPKENLNKGQAKAVIPATDDQLLVAGVEKRSVVVTFKGTFPNLLSFMRETELLEPLVVASDMKLQYLPSTNRSGKALSQTSPQITLKMKFSAYGRNTKTTQNKQSGTR